MFFRKFGEKLKSLFGGRKIDEAFFEELEDTLIEGDLGARLTDEIITELRETARKDKITEAADLQKRMKEILSGYIEAYTDKPRKGHLTVYMILGVNGVGKTTSIAKMAKRFTSEGYNVLLAAGDTFRAAAVDQLDIHAERLGIRIVKQQMGSDPASVAFDTLNSAKANNADVAIIDTAGRLHNKIGLMNELKKIPQIKDVRGKGLMIGIEFEQPIKEIRSKLLFEQKVFTGVSGTNVIRLLPPLILTTAQVDTFIERLKKVLS